MINSDMESSLIEKVGEYPRGTTVSRKRVTRRKSKKFVVKDGELFYKQNTKNKVGSVHKLSVTYSLIKANDLTVIVGVNKYFTIWLLLCIGRCSLKICVQ